MKRLAVLGSTGSIGTSTLDVVERCPDRFRVTSLAAGRNIEALRSQIIRHRPALVSVADAASASTLRADFPKIEIASGAEGLQRAACLDGVDMVVAALVGAVGLPSTVAAIRAGKDIALANKETLVAAGEIVMAEAARSGVRLVPVDSEHIALRQIIGAGEADSVRRLVLTASGGPFRTWAIDRINRATVEDALAHPTWRMGPKISIDSATMMNKGLEIIEAHHLFAMPEERIDVVVHPQSLVHSMVEYTDGSVIAQMAINDMRLPILAALSWPERTVSPFGRLDLVEVGRLDFAAPDPKRFPALGLSRHALRSGGELPAVLNAANEVAVQAFLAKRCTFDRIAATIDAVLNVWDGRNRSLESVEHALATDADARRITTELIGNSRG